MIELIGQLTFKTCGQARIAMITGKFAALQDRKRPLDKGVPCENKKTVILVVPSSLS